MLRPITLLILISFNAATFANTCDSTDQLNWLLGNWYSEGDKSDVDESWIQAGSATFEGVAKTLNKKGEQTFIESMRIAAMLDQVFFLAKTPGNSLPVPFTAISCVGQQVVFENRDHDFPNKITYTRTQSALHARVESNDGKGFELNFVAR